MDYRKNLILEEKRENEESYYEAKEEDKTLTKSTISASDVCGK